MNIVISLNMVQKNLNIEFSSQIIIDIAKELSRKIFAKIVEYIIMLIMAILL